LGSLLLEAFIAKGMIAKNNFGSIFHYGWHERICKTGVDVSFEENYI